MVKLSQKHALLITGKFYFDYVKPFKTLIFSLHSSYFEKIFQNVFSIWHYAFVSNQTSVLLIGGWSDGSRSSSIVEYKDDKWTVIGNLKQARYAHQAISIGPLVMIIGGYVDQQ